MFHHLWDQRDKLCPLFHYLRDLLYKLSPLFHHPWDQRDKLSPIHHNPGDLLYKQSRSIANLNYDLAFENNRPETCLYCGLVAPKTDLI